MKTLNDLKVSQLKEKLKETVSELSGLYFPRDDRKILHLLSVKKRILQKIKAAA